LCVPCQSLRLCVKLLSRSGATSSFDIGFAADLGVHHEVQQQGNVVTQLATIDNLIDHSVVEKELGFLKVFREFLTDGLFDHAWPGKADECFWLSDDNVAKHRETRGHAARSWIGQHRNEWQARFV